MTFRTLRKVALVAALAMAWSGVSQAAPRVGIVQLVEHLALDQVREAFTETLLEARPDVEIDYQNGQNNPSTINAICQKFVGDGVDLILAIATPAAQGAAAATQDIPIVFSAVTDPVAAGLVSNLERPDANLTGTSDAVPVEGIFDLAYQITPDIKTYGLLYNASEINSVIAIEEAKEILDARGLNYVEVAVTNIGEVTTAAQSMVGRVDAIFSPTDNTVSSAMANLAQVAIDAGLPTYVGAVTMVTDGALASVGVSYPQLGRQSARMAMAILDGTPVSEIPVELQERFDVAVNAETAAALGIDVSAYLP